MLTDGDQTAFVSSGHGIAVNKLAASWAAQRSGDVKSCLGVTVSTYLTSTCNSTLGSNAPAPPRRARGRGTQHVVAVSTTKHRNTPLSKLDQFSDREKCEADHGVCTEVVRQRAVKAPAGLGGSEHTCS